MEFNFLLLAFLIIGALIFVYLFALGYSMLRLKSVKQMLEQYDSNNGARPFFMRWTLLSLGFRRKQMLASVQKFGDTAITRLVKYGGLFLILACIFAVAMVVGILFFDL